MIWILVAGNEPKTGIKINIRTAIQLHSDYSKASICFAFVLLLFCFSFAQLLSQQNKSKTAAKE